MEGVSIQIQCNNKWLEQENTQLKSQNLLIDGRNQHSSNKHSSDQTFHLKKQWSKYTTATKYNRDNKFPIKLERSCTKLLILDQLQYTHHQTLHALKYTHVQNSVTPSQHSKRRRGATELNHHHPIATSLDTLPHLPMMMPRQESSPSCVSMSPPTVLSSSVHLSAASAAARPSPQSLPACGSLLLTSSHDLITGQKEHYVPNRQFNGF